MRRRILGVEAKQQSITNTPFPNSQRFQKDRKVSRLLVQVLVGCSWLDGTACTEIVIFFGAVRVIRLRGGVLLVWVTRPLDEVHPGRSSNGRKHLEPRISLWRVLLHVADVHVRRDVPLHRRGRLVERVPPRPRVDVSERNVRIFFPAGVGVADDAVLDDLYDQLDRPLQLDHVRAQLFAP